MKNSLGLKLNNTMIATIENKESGWKQIVICYFIYILIANITLLVLKSQTISTVLLAYTIAAIVCVFYMITFGKRTLPSLGMTNNFSREYLLGWLMATVTLLILWAINIVAGAISFIINPNFDLMVFILLFVGFIFQGFMEEFLLRGLIFTQFSIRFGVLMGVIYNSLIFSFGHVGNADASFISVANTFLIGVLFSLMYYYHDNIWLVSAFHSGWNFILGPVLGIVVSGFRLPTTLLLSVSNESMTSLNGGAYGLEASFLVTVAIIIMIFIYGYFIKGKKVLDSNHV